jgi:hypothetical protein
MPIYALTILILTLVVCYLIYRLTLASREKIVVLILDINKGTSWKIFDSMVEAKAFVKTEAPRKSICTIIRTTNVDKCVSNGH